MSPSSSSGRHRTETGIASGILWGATAAVVLPPLLLGGAHAAVIAALTAGAALLTLALVVRGWAGDHRSIRFTTAALPLAAICVVAAGQLVPLPDAVLKALSPRTQELWRLTVEGLSAAAPPAGLEAVKVGDVAVHAPGWRPLSLAPVQTTIALVRDLGALLLLGVGATFLGRPNRIRQVMLAVAWTGALLGAIGVAHRLLDVGRIYGFYTLPGAMSPFLVTPFVNQNHLAAFELLAVVCAAGLALDSRAPRERAIAIALGVAGAATMLATRSRGAVLGTAVAALCLFGLWAFSEQAPEERRFRRRSTFAGVTLALLIVGALLYWIQPVDPTTGLPGLLSDPKFRPWRDVGKLLAAFPLTGIGRGAFIEVYPAFKTIPDRLTFARVENEPLELLVDVGPLAGGLILATILAAGAITLWRLRKAEGPYSAAGAAIVGLGVQNLFDFSLQVAGVLFPAALLAGAALGAAKPLKEDRRRGVVLARRAARVALVAAGLGAAALGARAATHVLPREEAALTRAAAGGRTALLEAADESVRRHPTDSYLLLRVAAALLDPSTGDPRDAIKWINRAMYLNPTAGEPHLVAARALYALGLRGQARIEYRLAFEVWAGVAAGVREVVQRYPTLELLLPAIPLDRPDPVDAFVLELLARGRTADARAIVDAALEGLPANRLLLARRYQALTAGGAHAEAATVARTLAATAPTPALRAEALLQAAVALRAAGDLPAAMAAAREAASIDPSAPEPSIVGAELALAAKDPAGARALLDAARARVGGKPVLLARVEFVTGQVEAASGADTRAAVAFAAAIQHDPSVATYRISAAEAYLKIGDTPRAVNEYRALAAMGAAYAVYAARASELERSIGIPGPGLPSP